MALTPGTKLGPFEIVSTLGAGGMGEVYRARDTRLDRDVAIKILPEAFATDPGRLARFEREAKTLASLNHPHIAQLHGLEESGGVRGLVMELVEGEDLSRRIGRGAIPLDEALPIARQIADALEAAHEQGVVHRDLKPANIKLRPDGTVKILDFGLAKAVSQDDRGSSLDETVASAGPPLETIAGTGITMHGTIMGTAADMSPEQAVGKPVDKRSDLWSFGVVLFEMLSGHRGFPGNVTSEVLALVLTSEPDWTGLPDATPPLIRRLLRRCLEKDRKRRQADAADVRLEIEEAIAELRSSPSSPMPEPVPRRSKTVGWGLLVVSVVLALVLIARQSMNPATAPVVSRSLIDFPQSALSGARLGNMLAVSRDGARLVYVGNPDRINRLYLQRLDQFEATVIGGTENGSQPFFAPDGNWIGFFADGKLKTVSLSGGSPQTLADAVNPHGGSWGENGTIVFSPDGRGLMKTSSAGNAPQRLTERADGTFLHSWPVIVPGDATALFTSVFSDSSAAIDAVSLATGETRRVVDVGCCAAYAASGHLVYAHPMSGAVLAAQFDSTNVEVAGAPVVVLQGVMSSSANGRQFAVSDTGSLVYLRNQPVAERSMLWVDRAGRTTPIDFERHTYGTPSVSPDGRQVVTTLYEGLSPREIWAGDIERGTVSRLVSDGRRNGAPIWTRDGSRVTFQSTRDGTGQNIYWVRADGSGPIERLTTGDFPQVPTDWSPDGKTLVFYQVNRSTGYDIMAMTLDRERTVTPLIVTPFNEHTARISADGRFLAYLSNRSGRLEVYVQPFSGPGDVRQVSTDGGTEPVWSRTGKELFFRQNEKMMVVDVNTTTTFSASRPRALFEGRFEVSFVVPGATFYDVSPDGQRFLMLKSESGSAPRQLHLIVNWFEELKRAVSR